jgi:hypothetical protein
VNWDDFADEVLAAWRDRPQGETAVSFAMRVAPQFGGRPGGLRQWLRYRLRGDAAEGGQDVVSEPDKLAMLRREVARLQAALRRQQALRDLFRETVAAHCVALRPVSVSYPQARSRFAAEEAWFVISDMQAGAIVRPRDTAGLEAFGWDELERRVARWQERVAVIINDLLRKSLPIHDAEVLVLGDLVEGETVYPLQLAYLDRQLTEQVFGAARLLAQMLMFLAGMFRAVRVRTVEGNHGRVRDTTLNLDYMVTRIAALMCRDQPNLHVMLGESPFVAFAKPGPEGECRNFLLAHGDNIRPYLRLPYYDLDRAYGEYTDLTRLPFDCIFVGHHHRAVDIEGEKMVNGSWIGATDYTVRTLRAAARPNQWLLMYHSEVGFTAQRRIWLADQPCLSKPDDHGMYTPWSDAREKDLTGLKAKGRIKR